MIIGMFASTRGMKLAVLDLVRLLAAKKSLEINSCHFGSNPCSKTGYLFISVQVDSGK
jgi:hypothetical protein